MFSLNRLLASLIPATNNPPASTATFAESATQSSSD